jgi:FAD/FMN-containing dehydrogenase
LKQAVNGLGGFLVAETAPLGLRENREIWPRPSAYVLMKKLKTALDPNNILNPGKVVGGK